MEPILHDPNQPPTDAILVLSNELLDQIFGYLLTEPKRLLPSDHRASLSVESFQSTIEPAAPITEDSCTIRILVCSFHFRKNLERQNPADAHPSA